ncbi:centromere protein F [Notolabrus celidotus]|uniref:centromere protein F n=1 Tax=Notolabrus celidotus TaxID=1203425 RepID=UPI00148F932A|nr:centromere protein F [Notolabrus celidotus]
MSWAEDDWTVGLSGRVLQKVKELQVHQDRLSRENKQKQRQLDNINTSLEKQTAKHEEVRGELQYVHRELQSVRDEAKAAVTARERLNQELQTKQAQVCSFEGQLDAARTLNNKLTQEIKRLEAELEKLQNSSRSADNTLFSTPCWNTTSPWEHNGSRKEETTGQRDEGQSRAPHIRQRLQFSEVPPVPLSRPQHKSTPHRHSANQSETFSTPSAAFPWERDDSRPAARRRSPSSPHPQTPCVDVISQGQLEQRACGKETDHRAETDTSLSEMRSRVSALEEELSVKAGTLKSIQNEMMQSKKELTAKEHNIQRARDELSLAHTRMAQESERASGAEQRLKHLQEELKCQRQNTESSRLQHQQRSKELEKQHQSDLTELQKERQALEKQHHQEVNKLNQELQQARTVHNTLQAHADKLSLQKQALDKELDNVKEKLKWTEGQLQESQKKEAQTQAKLTEALRDAEGVAVSLEQSRKRERALEEEGRRLTEERADALHLLKELQEQKAASAPLQQPVQFCPVGQSFSAQPYHSPLSRPSPSIKKHSTANLAEQKRDEEEGINKRGEEVTASYPPDREPGEGIDSEHISQDSECLQRAGHGNNGNDPGSKSRNEGDIFEHALSSSSHSTAGLPTNNSIAGDVMLSVERTSFLNSEKATVSEDLKKENAALRSELNDACEELQKRLEDLEGQRRAETEARTRLKQLSRKHASQVVEKEEQDKGWKAQLERERAETERLRKAVAALETEMNQKNKEKENKEREEQEEEQNKVLQERESEMIELNFQLKKQLAEVKSQLALEKEERKREEEERNQMNTDKDVNNELSKNLEELKAELEELKRSRNEDLLEKEKLSVTNSPLTYLTLHNDELNSNMIGCDNKLLPSPVQHLLFCQSTNQCNMLVSQATADLIQEEGSVMDPVGTCLSDEGQTDEDTRKTLQKDEFSHSNLAKEVEQLQREKAKEMERCNQYQVKLEALQSQVTRQTKQLTMAFEAQSQHISGLLAELQEKESTLLRQGEELQRHKQELDTLKATKKEEKQERREELTVEEHGKQKEETQDEGSGETPGLEEHHHPDSGNTLSDADSSSVIRETESSQDGRTLDVAAELIALREENQLLRKRIDGFPDSAANTPEVHTDGKNQQDTARKIPNTGDAAVSRLFEHKEPLLADINALEQEDRGTSKVEREQEAESELQIVRLQQQVVELHTKLRSLSEETQQQAEELTMWRLASQPAPTFDLLNTENSEPQSDQQQTEGMTQDQLKVQVQNLGVQESPGNVTVIRGDELFLSCSSNRLQGRMLFSRLQHSNLPEPKSLHPSKKMAALQEYNQVTTKVDKEIEKENLDINVMHRSNIHQTQHKEKKDSEVIQMSSEKTGQQRVTKDVHVISGPNQTRTAECDIKNHEAKPENKINTTNDSSDGPVSTGMKSVSSQTEESFYLSAPTPPDLHCAYTQTEEEEEEEELVDSPPVSPVQLSEGAGVGDKRLFSGSFPIPADPAQLAERIRRNRTQLSAAFDDTEYEPYGLPEVVMKGFADIPSGPSCPYIVRRGLLGTSVVPAPQKDSRQEETD